MTRKNMGYFVFVLTFCWLNLGSVKLPLAQEANSPGEVVEITDILVEEKKAISLKKEALRAKEAQLKIIEQEILEKIQRLKKLEENLANIASNQEIEDSKIKEDLIRLGKVYEATPPEKAAKLLEKLDISLAAKILMQINPRKAGKIWGYIEPAQGVKISMELGKEVKPYGGGSGSGK